MTQKNYIDQLAQAIYTINRHAKAATEPKHLYEIKKSAIEKLINQNHAKKIGLHYSKNPKRSSQHSTVLVKIGDYFFHLPPKKDDFQNLEHLGYLDENYRNPQTRMSLSHSKQLIYRYIDWKPVPLKKPKHKASYYTPSSLGKMEWPPTKKF